MDPLILCPSLKSKNNNLSIPKCYSHSLTYDNSRNQSKPYSFGYKKGGQMSSDDLHRIAIHESYIQPPSGEQMSDFHDDVDLFETPNSSKPSDYQDFDTIGKKLQQNYQKLKHNFILILKFSSRLD
jgi:hypothetical protein